MSLHGAFHGQAVLAAPQRRQAIVVLHLPVLQVVPVQAILLDPQDLGLIRVSCCSGRAQPELVQCAALAIEGVDSEPASEQT